MRICMFNNLFPPIKSGSSHFTFMLSKMLVERGHEITVIGARVGDSKEYEKIDGIEVYRLPCLMFPQMEIAHGFKYLSFTFLPSNVKKIISLCREKQFDILHQHGQIFDTALSSSYAAKKLKIPLVTTIHTPVRHTVALYSKILVFLDKNIVKNLIVKHAQVLVAPDQTVVDNINERYDHSWVEEVPYGVDQLFATPEEGLEIRKKYNLGSCPLILSLGHVHNLRDRCDLISAMPEIIKHVPDVHLMIVGDIYIQKPIELVEKLGIKSHVTFTGGIPHEEIGAYFAAATIEAHWLGNAPGLGIAAMEAMAVGKPVVSSIGVDDLGKGVLQPGNNIVLIDRGVVPNIAESIIKLLIDPILRQQIGDNGRKMIEEHFSWQSVTTKMEKVYQKMTQEFNNTK
ncbi:MAG: glycosyltransferase family 4 protein [Acidobacteria bacterium]|nr:glycosyltransferase family 4 protein [Acidobacteriota bacterium]